MLALVSVACVPKVAHPDASWAGAAAPADPVVQLRQIPVAEPFGVHTFFVVNRGGAGWERWELLSSGGGNQVLRDAKPLDATFTDRTGAWIVHEWTGPRADRILALLNEETARAWTDRHPHYGLWPGPNSNSWPAWVLRKARVGHDTDDRAIGSDYPGWISAGLTPSRSGLHLDTPLLGVALGLAEGVELHLGFATLLGVDLWPPAITVPVGRIGFPEPHVVAGEAGR